VLNSQFTYIKSLNYQNRSQAIKGSTEPFNFNKVDANNFHLKVGLLYNL